MDRARYPVDAVLMEGQSLRSVASSISMSKSWVAKQVVRFNSGGYEALAPQSTAPHRRPTQTPVELENEIVTMRQHLDEEGLDAGPLTIQYHLRQRHGTAPGRSTIHRVLVRRGFVTPQPQKRPRTSWTRFEASLPNETWQADMTHWVIDDGTEEGYKVEISYHQMSSGTRLRRFSLRQTFRSMSSQTCWGIETFGCSPSITATSAWSSM